MANVKLSQNKVAEIATMVRAFFEPKFGKDGAAGHCFNAAHVLAYALNQHSGDEQWIAGEGVFASADVLTRVRAHELVSWSDIEDAGQAHGWVMSADYSLIVDVTADQFGLPPVLIMDTVRDAANWLPRYFPDIYPGAKTKELIAEWAGQDVKQALDSSEQSKTALTWDF